MEENTGAAAVKLTAEELKEIGATLSTIEVRGARMPESALTDQ